MKRKQIKCTQCGILYRERIGTPEFPENHPEVCSNCDFIYRVLDITRQSLETSSGLMKPLNRKIELDIKITKV